MIVVLSRRAPCDPGGSRLESVALQQLSEREY